MSRTKIAKTGPRYPLWGDGTDARFSVIREKKAQRRGNNSGANLDVPLAANGDGCEDTNKGKVLAIKGGYALTKEKRKNDINRQKGIAGARGKKMRMRNITVRVSLRNRKKALRSTRGDISWWGKRRQKLGGTKSEPGGGG